MGVGANDCSHPPSGVEPECLENMLFRPKSEKIRSSYVKPVQHH